MVPPSFVKALSVSTPCPAPSSDVDLAELSDQIIQFSKELWVLHRHLLVLLLMFVLLSLQCTVSKAGVIVGVSALVESRAGAKTGTGRVAVVVSAPVSVPISVPLC